MKQFDKITGYPPELRGRLNSFIVTEFDDSMTVEMQMRVLIKWIMKNIDLTNSMVDYLNEFIKNFDEKLYKTVEDILNKWLQDGVFDDLVNHVLFPVFNFKLDGHGIYITDYEKLNEKSCDGNMIWNNALKAAILEASKYSNTILFPNINKDYLFNPMSFEEFKDISGLKFVGLGSKIDENALYLWDDEKKPTNRVRITFCETGDIGFQFSDTTNPTPEWKVSFVTLENLWINGDKKVNNCLNGNFGLFIKNCFISHAIFDGIVFEDYTYPANITHSQITANGRHGLYVKGPNTTVYSIDNTNFSLNGEYGAYIISGDTVSLNQVLFQSNFVGGLKIEKRNDFYVANSPYYYLNNIVLNQVYFENNNILTESDPKYEGGYPLKIGYKGTSNSKWQILPSAITLNQCALNSKSGVSYYVDGVYGLFVDRGSINHEKSFFNIDNSTGFIASPVGTVVSFFDNIKGLHMEGYYHKDTNGTAYLVKSNQLIKKRGRYKTIVFSTTLKNGLQDLLPNDVSQTTGKPFGYPVANGSLVSLKISVPTVENGATIIVGCGVKNISGENDGLGWFGGQHTISKQATIIEFELTKYLMVDKQIGVKVECSGITNELPIIGYLEIED